LNVDEMAAKKVDQVEVKRVANLLQFCSTSRPRPSSNTANAPRSKIRSTVHTAIWEEKETFAVAR